MNVIKSCKNCAHLKSDRVNCHLCSWINLSYWKSNEVSAISFKRLNGLNPTIESCTMKLIEELGELLQIIGKGNQASGEPQSMNLSPERLIGEAFDVAQSAVTMIYTVADKWGIDVGTQCSSHEAKLIAKGYLEL